MYDRNDPIDEKTDMPQATVGSIGGGLRGVAPSGFLQRGGPLTPIAPMAQQGNGRSEIAHQLDAGEKAGHVLHQLVELLEQRLRPILSAPPPTGDGAGSQPIHSTQIGECLARNNALIGTGLERLRAIIDRIAL